MIGLRKIISGILSTTVAISAMSFCAFAAETPDLPVWDGTVATAFAGGSGTEADPYLISDGAQLALLMKNINDTTSEAAQATAGKYYELTNDIVLNDLKNFDSWSTVAPANEWVPGGSVDNYIPKGFAGFLDGNHYEIFGLYIENDDQYNGLFGYVYNGQVKDLGIGYAYVEGGSCTAALAGYVRASYNNTAAISGCTVRDSVVVGRNNVGAIGGYVEAVGGYVDSSDKYIETANNKVTFTKCANVSTAISGNNYVGGLIGLAAAYGVNYSDDEFAIAFTDCANSGSISGKKGVGGIIGSSKDLVSSPQAGYGGKIAMSFRNCFNKGVIAATTPHVGGIAGTVGPQDREDSNVVTKIMNCYIVDGTSDALYGYTEAATEANGSDIFTADEAKNYASFVGFEFDLNWIIADGTAPSLRVFGDAIADGKVTAQDVIDLLPIKAGAGGHKLYDFVNADIDNSGAFDLKDINLLMEYLKNKGAKGNTLDGTKLCVVSSYSKSQSGSTITYEVSCYEPSTGSVMTNIGADKPYEVGDIVYVSNGAVIKDGFIFGDAYTKGGILDVARRTANAGYVEVSSYDDVTGILTVSSSDAQFKVTSDTVITFSEKSPETFRQVEANTFITTNKNYHQDDDKTKPIRVLLCVEETGEGSYDVIWAIIVRD